MRAESALGNALCLPFAFLPLVEKAVGAEEAERSGKLLLDLRPGHPNGREAQGTG